MRIAVVVRGEYRNWDIVSKNIFTMFGDIDVDYFFSTWSVSYDRYNGQWENGIPKTITNEDVIKSFGDENLVAYEVNEFKQFGGPPTGISWDSWRQSHSWYYGNMLKVRYERKHDFKYDYVFCLRTDVVFATRSTMYQIPSTVTIEQIQNENIDNFTIIVDGCMSSAGAQGGLSMSDWSYLGTSVGMDILGDYVQWLREHRDPMNIMADTTHATIAEHLYQLRIANSHRFMPFYHTAIALQDVKRSFATLDEDDITVLNEHYGEVRT